MAIKAVAQAELCRLRRDIAAIEGRLPETEWLTFGPMNASEEGECAGKLQLRQQPSRLDFGVFRLDALLRGGLPLSALTEIRVGQSRDSGAATGFALALIARVAALRKLSAAVWICQAECRRETGSLYAPGVAALGLDPGSIIEVDARTEKDALWAFEAALSCPDLDVAVCDLREASFDLAATRRCLLRAREAEVTGLLLRVGSESEANAAELRFAVTPAPAGPVDRFLPGVGRMAWRLTLEKNRAGPTGAFTLEWNAHEGCFAERKGRNARSLPLPATARNRSSYPLAAAGSTHLLRRAS
jgi:protein ImuA